MAKASVSKAVVWPWPTDVPIELMYMYTDLSFDS